MVSHDLHALPSSALVQDPATWTAKCRACPANKLQQTVKGWWVFYVKKGQEQLEKKTVCLKKDAKHSIWNQSCWVWSSLLSIRAKNSAMSTHRFPSKNEMFIDFCMSSNTFSPSLFGSEPIMMRPLGLKLGFSNCKKTFTLCPLWLVNHHRGVDFLQLHRLKKCVNWLKPRSRR